MRRTHLLGAGFLALGSLGALGAGAPGAQGEWSPPSRAMPAMPTVASLDGDWRPALRSWFNGTETLSGVPLADVRAMGQGSGRAQFINFMGAREPRRVAAWSDRNGDGRCDTIEVFRGGQLAFQMVDADYDGHANVLRVYDSSGALVREDRF